MLIKTYETAVFEIKWASVPYVVIKAKVLITFQISITKLVISSTFSLQKCVPGLVRGGHEL
jgi:hypothetical protein